MSLATSQHIQPTQVPLRRKRESASNSLGFKGQLGCVCLDQIGAPCSAAQWLWAKYFHLLCLSYLLCRTGLFRVSML